MIFLVAAIVLASLTGLALYGVAQQANAKGSTAADVKTIQVVVATSDIPVRTSLTQNLVSTRAYPVDLVPTGALTNASDAIGRTTSSPIAAGQAIVQAQLASATGNRAVSTTIEKGKVLFAFPTADPLTLAGLLNIGDHIDILATVKQGTGENQQVSQTTLQDLEVLDIIAPSKDGTTKTTSLVFAVDHQVALVLKFLRDSQASIDVTVRSRAEGELAKTTAVDLGFLVQTYGFR
ncbi:MAG TPA: Flp pilus assembly protein CpaB [Candidatus Limnocylindria bacterium]